MASIKIAGDTSGDITISTPAVAGANTLTLPATTQTLATQNSLGLRNRIINGDMSIDQRNAGASITITTGGGYFYPVDRFGNFNNSGTNYTAQQVVDAPAGFVQSTKLTFASAITLTTQNEATFFHVIEGFNVLDLGWGTANAQTISVSLWVKASFTGTFSIGFCNDGGTRAYATTYTIDAANTWEYKTFTIAGDTSGTWLKNNGAGLYVRWNIIAGSNFNVAANDAWETKSGSYNAANGTYGTKAIGSATSISAGATWQVTGVQLEVGTEATPFEHRPYDMEFASCQRYYQVGDVHLFAGGGNSGDGTVLFPVQMRANPTVTFSDNAGTVNTYSDSAGNGLSFPINVNSANTYRFRLQNLLARTATWWEMNYKLSAEL